MATFSREMDTVKERLQWKIKMGCFQQVVTLTQSRREPATLKTGQEEQPTVKHEDTSERIQKRRHYRISKSCRKYPSNACIDGASDEGEKRERPKVVVFDEIITRTFSKSCQTPSHRSRNAR